MKLHHIGYVTDNLEKKSKSLCSLLGLECKNEIIVDSGQDVRILFIDTGETQLELIEPLGPNSPVQNHLAKGGGLYHLCFEVDDLDATLERLQKSRRAMVVKSPLQAPAIDGKRVAFVVTEDGDLVEFVESDKG